MTNQVNNLSIIPPTDVKQLTLTLKMTTGAQVVEKTVTVNNNGPIQDYVHPDDQTQPTFEYFPAIQQILSGLVVSGWLVLCSGNLGHGFESS